MIDVQDLTVRYGRTLALDRVSFSAKRGVVGLLGPNGAGKTTLISVLAGNIRPTSGRALIGGLDGHHEWRSRRSTVGYLPQSFDLASGMRLRDVAEYAAWCHGLPQTELAELAERALGLVDLLDKARDRVRHLSGGERQRLGLAASLVHKPKILLLDEPTAGLDPDQRVRFREYIGNVANDVTIVLATHLLEDVGHSADRIVVMSSGTIAFSGSVSELLSRSGKPASKSYESQLEAAYRSILSDNETGLE